jgi:hypothetical protein
VGGRHADVHQYDLRTQAPGLGEYPVVVGRDPDDVDLGLLQKPACALPEQELVLGYQDFEGEGGGVDGTYQNRLAS